LIKVTTVGNAHGIKLILEVPLKTESQSFTLFRIIVLPTPVLNDTFALYELEYYFGLSHSQRDYILMTAADVQKCNAGSITICLADRALYDTRSVTCESRLYFQTPSKDGLCKRSLMVHYREPTLLRHGEVWVFHLANQRQENIRCPRNMGVTRTRSLSGPGLIHNATRCSITTGEIRTLPELHGVAHANLVALPAYVPDSSPILAKHELPRVEEALAPGVNDLDQLKERLEAEQKLLDVDTLVHIQKATPYRETPPHWHLIITAASCALAVLLAIGMFLQSKFQCAVSCCRRTSETTEENTPRPPTQPVPDTGNPTANTYAEHRCDGVTFTAYALPCKD